MSDDVVTKEKENAPATDAAPAVPAKTDGAEKQSSAPEGGRKPGGKAPFKKNFRKNPRRAPRRRQRPKPEFEHRILDIRRVTRVMAGGRRFSFSVALVAGDRKGRVGVGVGKAGDTALAIEKALRVAKKNMITVNRTKDFSLPHAVEAKYASAVIKIMPSPGKGGITAGGAVRTILEFAGITDVTGKILSRTKNKINNARATIKALEQLAHPSVPRVKKPAPKAKKKVQPEDAMEAKDGAEKKTEAKKQ